MTADEDSATRLLGALRGHVVELDGDLRVRLSSRPLSGIVVGESFLPSVPSVDRQAIKKALERVLDDGTPLSYTYQAQGRHMTTWVTRFAAAGEEHHLCLRIEDTTAAIHEQRRRHAEQQKLEVALGASGVGLWSWHLPTNEIRWDQRMHEITGRSEPIDLPEWIDDLVHPDDRAAIRELTSAEGESIQFPADMYRIVRPDGQVRWILTSGATVEAPSGEPEWLVGGVMDVTEQQRAAERLQEAQRVESLTNLTSGVAHNFNNMLMIIGPCLEFIRESADSSVHEDIDDALKATQRATEIVAELMTLSGRQTKRERVTLSASEICLETARLCLRSFPKRITMQSDIETTASIRAVPGAIEQVLGNILFNARDAVVQARTESPLIGFRARDVDYFGDRWLEITITDNGPGVPKEMRSKIFEPFVTTKGGDGTGLGLASSMALVQQHGGQLAHRPTDGGGAEFLVLLPRQQADDPGDEAAPESALRPSSRGRLSSTGPSSTGRVLVVDDEEAIRRVLGTGLPRLGFEVCVVEGRADLEETLEQDTNFGVVLLDRSLKDEDGSQLLPVLRAKLPRAKIFFFTGEFVSEDDAHLVDGVVSKPANLKALAEIIGQATSA